MTDRAPRALGYLNEWGSGMTEREPFTPRLFDRTNAARRRDFLINLVYAVTWAVLLGGAVWLVGRWLWPFVAAFVTATVLQRPLRWLSGKTRASRRFSSGVLVVAAMGLLAAAIGLIGWWLWRAAVGFFGDEEAVAAMGEAITSWLYTLRERLDKFIQRLSPETRAALAAAFGGAGDSSVLRDRLVEAAAGLLGALASRLPRVMVGFLVWVIASVFLTVDYRRVTAFFARQIPPHRRALAADAKTLFCDTVGRMLRAYGLLLLLTFGELLAGFWLIGVKSAPLAAALIALVDLLPILGVGTVLFPWAGAALLGGDVRRGVCLLVLLAVITVVRRVVEPRVIGERVGLPPLVTLVSLYLGWRAAGIVGVLLLPPLVTVLVQLQQRGRLPLWK